MLKLYVPTSIAWVLIAMTFFTFNSVLKMALITRCNFLDFFFIDDMIDTIDFINY